MRKSRRIATVIAGAGLVALAGVAAAQGPGPRLSADSLAQQLGLDAAARAEIAPRVDELNTLLSQLDQGRAEHQRLWAQLRDVRDAIAENLTPAQRQQFGGALRQAWGAGPGAYGGGCAGFGGAGYGGRMGPGGHMGYPGSGGPGWMRGGGMMGSGSMGGMMGPGWGHPNGMYGGGMGGRTAPRDSGAASGGR